MGCETAKEAKPCRARVYIAGPITKGDQLANIAKGISAAESLLIAGFAPFSPHAMSAQWHMMHPHTWDEWLDYDFAWIVQCEAVFRIPGDSLGADKETAFAESRGIPVFHTVDELCNHFPETR